MVGITAGPARHETLSQLRDRLAQQDQQHVPAGYHSTFEIVTIGLVSEGDIAGNPATGDVIIDFSTDDGGSRTYGWIAAPAQLTASNTTTRITQEVVGDQTWFRIDIPAGASSDITVHHERDTHGEFTLGWTVGMPQPGGD